MRAAETRRTRTIHRPLVRAVIGDRPPPSSPVREFAVAAGRRSGKDCAAATLAVYLSCLVDHSHVLRRGERGVVLCVGADQQQAKVTKGYCEGMLAESPVLSAMVANVTQDEIELTNGIVISVRAASFRRLRGLTLIGAICSELAFWIDSETSANPADEILSAIRPATLTTAAPITMISSPYSRSGPLFDTWRDYYGKDDPEVLVAGKDAISHPRGGHDDSGNAIAGVAWIAGDGAPKSGMRVGHYPLGGGLITWLDTNGERPSALRGGAHQTARASGRYWKRWNPNRNCFE